MEANEEAESKCDHFLRWLQANGAELRGCAIRCSGPSTGYGVFSSSSSGGGGGTSGGPEVLLVVPLDLAITPMSVLRDPLLGPRCGELFEEGDVDDRFMIMLFLTVQRLRKNSPWKPYLDMLPTAFGNPLWFTDDELDELKGTALYRATILQKKKLQGLFEEKAKHLVGEFLLLDGESESEVRFEDFLWANSIFWTRALNIPFPHSYVFPQSQEGKGGEETPSSEQSETVWVEGLVPGIDFCNHGLKAQATWEVDGAGSITGIPSSMYLLSAEQNALQADKEICISYGNKGNEELLYLYGFVIDNNPDDYLMVHYPIEALKSVPFSDVKGRLLELQKAEMRFLLPRSLLDHGFFSKSPVQDKNKCSNSQFHNYSWSGHRKAPSYLNKLVFPEEFLAMLRTIAMKEDEINQVSSLLEQLIGSGNDRQPSDQEVQAAVWEACGDSGALQLLVDLLNVKMMELEEGSGTEDCDAKILENTHVCDVFQSNNIEGTGHELMTKNRWSSIVYRRGQKQLTRLFLKEAVHALELCLNEQP
ncbi:hypothetical protein QJS10_CPB15g00658 [Acorus calamus]|uniref:SET domain-containing protein n=1 Tax=Acorus calamus TaxID=4465 RepID=A0AAV9D933_ACOCL|nr:hypothetical protein QJS10_CPB15g00658 [Acorus calamus]